MYLDLWVETIEPNYGDFRKRYYIPTLQIWKSISGVCQTQNDGFTVVSFSKRWFFSSKPRWKHPKILMCFAPSPSDIFWSSRVRWGRRFWRPWELVKRYSTRKDYGSVPLSFNSIDHLAGNDLQHLSTSMVVPDSLIVHTTTTPCPWQQEPPVPAPSEAVGGPKLCHMMGRHRPISGARVLMQKFRVVSGLTLALFSLLTSIDLWFHQAYNFSAMLGTADLAQMLHGAGILTYIYSKNGPVM